MSISQLYAETIKRHNQSPVGKNACFAVTHAADGYNASCGDELSLYFQLTDNEQIGDIGFTADACAICTASLSLLCEHSKQRNIAQIRQDIQTISEAINHNKSISIKPLNCLSGVSAHKSRINCALLPWHTFARALDNLSAAEKPEQHFAGNNHG
jgi:nitrogen fixation protein NifU and related proteins